MNHVFLFLLISGSVCLQAKSLDALFLRSGEKQGTEIVRLNEDWVTYKNADRKGNKKIATKQVDSILLRDGTKRVYDNSKYIVDGTHRFIAKFNTGPLLLETFPEDVAIALNYIQPAFNALHFELQYAHTRTQSFQLGLSWLGIGRGQEISILDSKGNLREQAYENATGFGANFAYVTRVKSQKERDYLEVPHALEGSYYSFQMGVHSYGLNMIDRNHSELFFNSGELTYTETANGNIPDDISLQNAFTERNSRVVREQLTTVYLGARVGRQHIIKERLAIDYFLGFGMVASNEHSLKQKGRVQSSGSRKSQYDMGIFSNKQDSDITFYGEFGLSLGYLFSL